MPREYTIERALKVAIQTSDGVILVEYDPHTRRLRIDAPPEISIAKVVDAATKTLNNKSVL